MSTPSKSMIQIALSRLWQTSDQIGENELPVYRCRTVRDAHFDVCI